MKGTTSHGGFTSYVSVINGMFAERVKEPNEKTTTRTNKNGKEVYELYHDYISGTIAGIEKVDSEYGFQLVIDINDADEKNKITVSFYDRAVRTILNKLVNTDFSSPVTLLVGKNDEGHTWFTVKQPGKGYEKDIVPNAFTNEQLPKPQQVRVQGKDTWLYDPLTDFIWDELKKKVSFEKPAAPAPAAKKADDDWDFPVEPHKPANDSDDLPF